MQHSPRALLFLGGLLCAAAVASGCSGDTFPSEEPAPFDERCDASHPEFPPVALPTGTSARACFDDLECTDVYVIAHRGNRQHGAPENSLQALRDAARDGVPIVEVDLRTTADGVVINMHDSSLQRTTGVDKKVRDVTWAEIETLALHTNDGKTHTIPTFDALLTEAKELGLALFLDIKDVAPDVLVEHLQRHNAEDIALLRVTSVEELVALYALEPSLWVTYRTDTLDALLAAREAVPSLNFAKVPVGDYHALVADIRQAGFQVQQDVMATGDVIWIAKGSPLLWFETIDAGVNMLQSDRPGDLVSVLCDAMGR